ncbi:MAG: thioredoxin-disulfide reductase [Candidatus Saccharibacteria bacterium]|nr:thioredoxin-disulfide reductase [Candidatus Saccharibacteria bacterium]
MSEVRKVIIIGSGPAGLTAAIYAGRANLKPLLIEGEPNGAGDQPGGQLMNTTEIENFPGVLGFQGPELMGKIREQAAQFGAEIITKRATKVDFSSRPFKVWVGDDLFEGETIIVSTGAKPLMLGLEDEWRLMGRGVSTCATCDGFFFRGKDIAVVGGGDAAMEEAIFLTNFANSVTVIHRRDKLRASQVMADRALANPKIKFQWNAKVAEIKGENKLESVILEDTSNGKKSPLALDGLFVAIGHKPSSELFEGQLNLDSTGYIITDGVSTSIPGIYACGDVQDKQYRQAITSAGTGCMAALDAQKFLEEHEATVQVAAAVA